jgi:hypothetical protein
MEIACRYKYGKTNNELCQQVMHLSDKYLEESKNNELEPVFIF